MATETSYSNARGDQAVPLLIDGQEVFGREGSNTFDVTSPASGEFLWRCTSSTKENALAAAESASKAFLLHWSKTTPRERRDLFLRAAELLEQRAVEFAQYAVKETGAAEDFALRFDVPQGVETLREVAGKISSIYGAIPMASSLGTQSLIVKEPYGVILAIAPWNAPYILGFRSVVYALAAGNTCVLKGSEVSPRCFWAIGDLFIKAGLPPGCLNVLYHRTSDAPEITAALVGHPAIRKVNFTGSTNVGRIIAQLSGKHLKPCLLELGGKASAIVLEDADIAQAALECAKGAFFHTGQICMSTERILVHRRILTPFKAALQQIVDGMFPQSGPAPVLAMAAGIERHQRLVTQARSAGAEIIGGSDDARSKQAALPVLVVGVNQDMDIYHEESFGPSVSLIAIGGEEEAVRIANDTEYGLTASIFTRDLHRALKLAREIQSGAVHINSMTVHDDLAIPHGGTKSSGWGRFNAQWGMDEFLQCKTITF